MPAGITIKHKRKAGAFANGELAAGEWGLDVSGVMWYFSANGTTVVQFGTPTQMLSALTDVAVASITDKQVFAYDSATSKWKNMSATAAGLLATADKGASNGVASLGSDGKIPASQLPAMAITTTSVVASQAAQLALTAQAGDVAIRSDQGVSYIHNGGSAGTMADWTELKANDTTVDGSHITGGDIAAARMSLNVVAAINSSAAATINNPALILDGGTL